MLPAVVAGARTGVARSRPAVAPAAAPRSPVVRDAFRDGTVGVPGVVSGGVRGVDRGGRVEVGFAGGWPFGRGRRPSPPGACCCARSGGGAAVLAPGREKLGDGGAGHPGRVGQGGGGGAGVLAQGRPDPVVRRLGGRPDHRPGGVGFVGRNGGVGGVGVSGVPGLRRPGRPRRRAGADTGWPREGCSGRTACAVSVVSSVAVVGAVSVGPVIRGPVWASSVAPGVVDDRVGSSCAGSPCAVAGPGRRVPGRRVSCRRVSGRRVSGRRDGLGWWLRCRA